MRALKGTIRASAIIGLALLVGISLLLRYVLTPSDYSVTLFNRDTTTIVNGTLAVNRAKFEFQHLLPDEAVTFKVHVRSDGHYVVRASWENGRTLIDSTGYVTHGISASETLEVRSASLTLAGATFR